MAKLDLSKKTLKKKILLCILYHDKKINLKKLLNKIQLKFIQEVLIINDGIKYHFKDKRYGSIKFINEPKKKFSIPINRNIALKYAKKKKFDLILFLDSDIIPQKRLVENHLKAHIRHPETSIIGGPVLPSFKIKNFNFWEFLDGRLSWFTSVDNNLSHYVRWPYHLPTCNLSIQISKLLQKKILFNEIIQTGEDADLFSQIRKKKLKAFFDKDCKVEHNDRKNFLSFINHHLKWGRHQYYNLFKLDKKKIIEFLFIILFPFIYPILIVLQTFFVIKKWCSKNIFYIFLLPIFLLIFSLKSLATYFESYNSFFK
ncbi:glycosyltransferase [Candidatus Pelagibacter sp. HIMB1483]|uniref:glycosyltransferase n=1 Tax=Candidatus Pelagibacter sp. HIMB1483 TaxID=3415414 RepID=UPI003F863FE3